MRVYLVLIASVFSWGDVVTYRSTSKALLANHATQIRRHWVDAKIPSYIYSKNRRQIADNSHSGYSNGASPIPVPPIVGEGEIESPPFRYHQNPEENTTTKKVEPRVHQKHERLIAKKLKFASYRRSQSLNQPKREFSTELSQISQALLNDSISIDNNESHENKSSKRTRKYSRRKSYPTISELHDYNKLEPNNSVFGVIYNNNKRIIVKYDKKHSRVQTFGTNNIKELTPGHVNSNSVSKKKNYLLHQYADHSNKQQTHGNNDHDHEHRRKRPTKIDENSEYNHRPSTDQHRDSLPPNNHVVGEYVTNLHGSFPPDYQPWQNFDNVENLETTHQSYTGAETENDRFGNLDKDEEDEPNYFENNNNQSISTENSEALWFENDGTDHKFQGEEEPLNFGSETSFAQFGTNEDVHPDKDEEGSHEQHDVWDEEENYASTEINFTQNPSQSGEQSHYEHDNHEEEAEDQSSFHRPHDSYPNEDNYDEHDINTDINAENGDLHNANQKPGSESFHDSESDAVISNYPGELVSPENEGGAIQSNTDNQYYSSFEQDDRPNYSGDTNSHDDGYPFENEDDLYSHEGHYSENGEDEYSSNYRPTSLENDNLQQPPLLSTSYPSTSGLLPSINSSHAPDYDSPVNIPENNDYNPQLKPTKPPNYSPVANIDSHFNSTLAPAAPKPEEVDPNVAPSSHEQQLQYGNPSLASFTESQNAPTRPNSPLYQNNYPKPTYTPPYDYDDDENIDDYYEEDNTVPSVSAYYSTYPPEPENDSTVSTSGYDDEEPYDEEPYDEDLYEEIAPSEDEYTASYEDKHIRRSKRRLRSTLRKRRRISIKKFSEK